MVIDDKTRNEIVNENNTANAGHTNGFGQSRPFDKRSKAEPYARLRKVNGNNKEGSKPGGIVDSALGFIQSVVGRIFSSNSKSDDLTDQNQPKHLDSMQTKRSEEGSAIPLFVLFFQF